MSTKTLYAACTCVDWAHAWPQRQQWWPSLNQAHRDRCRATEANHVVRQITTVEIVTEDET